MSQFYSMLSRFRVFHFLGFLLCVLLLGWALFAQYVEGLNPCPLCLLQRIVFISLGFIFLIAFLHGPKKWGKWVYTFLIIVVGMIGVGIATRHLWIQSLPPGQVPSCGAPIGYLLETRSQNGGLWGVLKLILSGSGECAKVDKVLGLSIPWWSLMFYLLLQTLSFVGSIKSKFKNQFDRI